MTTMLKHRKDFPSSVKFMFKAHDASSILSNHENKEGNLPRMALPNPATSHVQLSLLQFLIAVPGDPAAKSCTDHICTSSQATFYPQTPLLMPKFSIAMKRRDRPIPAIFKRLTFLACRLCFLRNNLLLHISGGR